MKYVGAGQKWDFFRADFWGPYHLFQFSANFSFGAKFDNEVQQTLCGNFNDIIYNSYRFRNAILHQNPSTGSEDIIDWISKNVWNL